MIINIDGLLVVGCFCFNETQFRRIVIERGVIPSFRILIVTEFVIYRVHVTSVLLQNCKHTTL